MPSLAQRYGTRGSVQKEAMQIIREATGLETKTDDVNGKRKLAANLYSLHSFRHTFVSFCANAGVPLEVVASIVGHCSPVMTRHYTHITDEARRSVLNALPDASENASDLDRQRRRLMDYISTASREELDRLEKLLYEGNVY